jgi:hypothetical protein
MERGKIKNLTLSSPLPVSLQSTSLPLSRHPPPSPSQALPLSLQASPPLLPHWIHPSTPIVAARGSTISRRISRRGVPDEIPAQPLSTTTRPPGNRDEAPLPVTIPTHATPSSCTRPLVGKGRCCGGPRLPSRPAAAELLCSRPREGGAPTADPASYDAICDVICGGGPNMYKRQVGKPWVTKTLRFWLHKRSLNCDFYGSTHFSFLQWSDRWVWREG